MNTSSHDNRFPVGISVRAKADPLTPLIILNYYQRIYYCAVEGQPEHRHFVYFEHELMRAEETAPPPTNTL